MTNRPHDDSASEKKVHRAGPAVAGLPGDRRCAGHRCLPETLAGKRSGKERAGAVTKAMQNTRLAPLWLLMAVPAANVGFAVIATFAVSRSFWLSLYRPTFGLVNLAYIACTLFVIGGVLLFAGRRQLAEVGIEPAKLPAGLLFSGLVWIALQLAMLGWYGLVDRPIRIASEWYDTGPLRLAGGFVGHFFGYALNEEVVFRGFLFTQFVLALGTALAAVWPRGVITHKAEEYP